MLALALGFLGAVLVLGAFCGGVFLGCWLCGEEGTPVRARPARKRARRRKRRRSSPDRTDDGYGMRETAAAREADPWDAVEQASGQTEAETREPVQTEAEAWEPIRADAESREPVRADAESREPVRADAESREPVRADAEAREPVRADAEAREREEARRRRRLLDEQAAFRALQRYSAEHAYGLDSPSPIYDRNLVRSGLD